MTLGDAQFEIDSPGAHRWAQPGRAAARRVHRDGQRHRRARGAIHFPVPYQVLLQWQRVEVVVASRWASCLSSCHGRAPYPAGADVRLAFSPQDARPHRWLIARSGHGTLPRIACREQTPGSLQTIPAPWSVNILHCHNLRLMTNECGGVRVTDTATEGLSARYGQPVRHWARYCLAALAPVGAAQAQDIVLGQSVALSGPNAGAGGKEMNRCRRISTPSTRPVASRSKAHRAPGARRWLRRRRAGRQIQKFVDDGDAGAVQLRWRRRPAPPPSVATKARLPFFGVTGAELLRSPFNATCLTSARIALTKPGDLCADDARLASRALPCSPERFVWAGGACGVERALTKRVPSGRQGDRGAQLDRRGRSGLRPCYCQTE